MDTPPSVDDRLTSEQRASLAEIIDQISQERMLKYLSQTQIDLLEEALLEVRRKGGFGIVFIECQAGTIKYIGTKIKKEA